MAPLAGMGESAPLVRTERNGELSPEVAPPAEELAAHSGARADRTSLVRVFSDPRMRRLEYPKREPRPLPP